jgi:hypothetical protein
MDERAHTLVQTFFKDKKQTRPVKLLLQHYSNWVVYQQNCRTTTSPSEQLSFIRRGFLAQLKVDKGACFGFTKQTTHVAVLNIANDYIVVHGSSLEILMAAVGSEKTIVDGLVEMNAHMTHFDDNVHRAIVVYVISPWGVDVSQIACEIRCTQMDGSSDLEALYVREMINRRPEGRMVFNVPPPLIADCPDVNNNLRTRVVNQFTKCNVDQTDQVDAMVPKSIADSIVMKNRELRQALESEQQRVAKLEAELQASKEMNRASMVAQNEAIELLSCQHKKDKHLLEEQLRKMQASKEMQQASIAAQNEAIERLSCQYQKTYNEKIKSLEAQLKLCTTDLVKKTEKNQILLNDVKRKLPLKLTRLATIYERTLWRQRRARIVASLIHYLKREREFHERAEMKRGVMRKYFKLQMDIQLRVMKEMLNDCDIDIFTMELRINEMWRSNLDYVRHIVMDKRKRNTKYSSKFNIHTAEFRNLIHSFRQTHALDHSMNPATVATVTAATPVTLDTPPSHGFYYPICASSNRYSSYSSYSSYSNYSNEYSSYSSLCTTPEQDDLSTPALNSHFQMPVLSSDDYVPN